MDNELVGAFNRAVRAELSRAGDTNAAIGFLVSNIMDLDPNIAIFGVSVPGLGDNYLHAPRDVEVVCGYPTPLQNGESTIPEDDRRALMQVASEVARRWRVTKVSIGFRFGGSDAELSPSVIKQFPPRDSRVLRLTVDFRK